MRGPDSPTTIEGNHQESHPSPSEISPSVSREFEIWPRGRVGPKRKKEVLPRSSNRNTRDWGVYGPSGTISVVGSGSTTVVRRIALTRPESFNTSHRSLSVRSVHPEDHGKSPVSRANSLSHFLIGSHRSKGPRTGKSILFLSYYLIFLIFWFLFLFWNLIWSKFKD